MTALLGVSTFVLLVLLSSSMMENRSLKRRMKYLVMGLKIEPRHELEPPPRPPDYPRRSQLGDVQLALHGLGYTKRAAKTAAIEAAKLVDGNDFEALLRKALQMRGAA